MHDPDGVAIVAAAEVPYARHPDASTTGDLLARSFMEVLSGSGLGHPAERGEAVRLTLDAAVAVVARPRMRQPSEWGLPRNDESGDR